ncbi:5-hydroxytryptamine receptor [Gryllus bimaculatus]|nr:5-hydroxytryptamine receptor [Gryllus bimaculatus]
METCYVARGRCIPTLTPIPEPRPHRPPSAIAFGTAPVNGCYHPLFETLGDDARKPKNETNFEPQAPIGSHRVTFTSPLPPPPTSPQNALATPPPRLSEYGIQYPAFLYFGVELRGDVGVKSDRRMSSESRRKRRGRPPPPRPGGVVCRGKQCVPRQVPPEEKLETLRAHYWGIPCNAQPPLGYTNLLPCHRKQRDLAASRVFRLNLEATRTAGVSVGAPAAAQRCVLPAPQTRGPGSHYELLRNPVCLATLQPAHAPPVPHAQEIKDSYEYSNVFVIAAILLERNLQNVANYLIVSLAVADLMVACLVMPLGAVYEKTLVKYVKSRKASG